MMMMMITCTGRRSAILGCHPHKVARSPGSKSVNMEKVKDESKSIITKIAKKMSTMKLDASHLDPAHPVLGGEVSVAEVGHAWRLPGLRVFFKFLFSKVFVLQLLPW